MKALKRIISFALLTVICLLCSCHRQKPTEPANVILIPDMETPLLLYDVELGGSILIDCDVETDSRAGKHFNREDVPQTYSLTFDGRAVTGIYQYSLRHPYYRSDIDVYKILEEDGNGSFTINVQENRVVNFNPLPNDTGTEGTKLSRDELLHLAEEALAEYVPQSESYILHSNTNPPGSNSDFCFRKYVGEIPTCCYVRIELTSNGTIASFYGTLMMSLLETPEISIDTQTRDQMIHDKMQTILADKFDQIQYEIKDTSLIHERDGSYSIEYVIKITETNSEKPKTDHVWLLMHLKETTQ